MADIVQQMKNRAARYDSRSDTLYNGKIIAEELRRWAPKVAAEIERLRDPHRLYEATYNAAIVITGDQPASDDIAKRACAALASHQRGGTDAG